MTPVTAGGSSPSSPWQYYLGREHAARDMYLNVVGRAHQEYLTGPYPDRDAYQVVERQAWLTYYAAGRQAWIDYQAALNTPPPPPPPTEAGHPYPQSRFPFGLDSTSGPPVPAHHPNPESGS